MTAIKKYRILFLRIFRSIDENSGHNNGNPAIMNNCLINHNINILNTSLFSAFHYFRPYNSSAFFDELSWPGVVLFAFNPGVALLPRLPRVTQISSLRDFCSPPFLISCSSHFLDIGYWLLNIHYWTFVWHFSLSLPHYAQIFWVGTAAS